MRRAANAIGQRESICAALDRAGMADPLDELRAYLRRTPGAFAALRDMIDVQLELELEASGRVLVVDCARRAAEMSTSDLPASQCTWEDAPAIGGYRCRVCGRAEVQTARALQIGHRLAQVAGRRKPD
jgi:hypothetical protein